MSSITTVTVNGQRLVVASSDDVSHHHTVGFSFCTLDTDSNINISTDTDQANTHIVRYQPSSNVLVAVAGDRLSVLPAGAQLCAHATDNLHTDKMCPIRLSDSDGEVLAKLLRSVLVDGLTTKKAGTSQVSQKELDDIRNADVHQLLLNQLKSNPSKRDRPEGFQSRARHLQSNIVVVVPRFPFLSLCNALLLSKQTESSYSALASTLEQLHWNSNGERLRREGPGQRYHVEYNRLKSFEGASISTGAEHLNDQFADAAPSLAAAGFYYVSSQTDAPSGYCVHFETGASIPTTSCSSFVSLLNTPWKELETLCPDSNFIQGRATCNVPLSVSITAMNSQSCHHLSNTVISESKEGENCKHPKHPTQTQEQLDSLATISSLSVPTCTKTSSVATGCENGILAVWSTSMSQTNASPALAYRLNTLLDVEEAKSKVDEETLTGTWCCPECDTENDYEEGHGERCEMCDTPNPTQPSAGSGGMSPVEVVAGEDDLLSKFSRFLKRAGPNRKLVDVALIPLPRHSDEDFNSTGDASKVSSSKPEEKYEDPSLDWAGGWCAPNIVVHIIEGVYSGTDASVVSSGAAQCMIRTAFDSTEFVQSSQLKAKTPEKNDKAVVIGIEGKLLDDRHKGRVGKVVRVAGVTGTGGTVSVQAVLQFQPGDPPSKHYTTMLSNLAKFVPPTDPSHLRQSSAASMDGSVLNDMSSMGGESSGSAGPNVTVENSVVAVVAGNGKVGMSVYRHDSESSTTAHHQFLEVDSTLIRSDSGSRDDEVSYHATNISVLYNHFNNILTLCTTSFSKQGEKQQGAQTSVVEYNFDHNTNQLVSVQKNHAFIRVNYVGSVVSIISLEGHSKWNIMNSRLVLYDDGTLQRLDTHSDEIFRSNLASLGDDDVVDDSFVDLTYDASDLENVLLYAVRRKGSVVVLRVPNLLGDQKKKQQQKLEQQEETTNTTTQLSSVPFDSSVKGPFRTTKDILQLHDDMEWQKLCFHAHGPPGQLRCSNTTSGTNMRWRAQTGYESNRLRTAAKDLNSDSSMESVFKQGLHVQFSAATDEAQASTSILNNVVDSGKIYSLQDVQTFGWMHDSNNFHEGVNKGDCEWRILVPKQGQYHVEIGLQLFKELAFVNIEINDRSIFARSGSTDLKEEYQNIPSAKFIKVSQTFSTKRDAASSNYLSLKWNVVGAAPCSLCFVNIRFALEANNHQNVAPMLTEYQPTDNRSGEQKKDLPDGQDDMSLLAPPALLRQHTDLLGARKSALARRLEWELDLKDSATLGLLDVRLELQTQELTVPTLAASFGENQNYGRNGNASSGGILCPIHQTGRIHSSRSWSIECWIKPNFAASSVSETVSSSSAAAAASSSTSISKIQTILLKSTSEAEGNVPQFELVCTAAGGLDIVVYSEMTIGTKLGKKKSKIGKFRTSLNPRTGNRLKEGKWTHVAAVSGDLFLIVSLIVFFDKFLFLIPNFHSFNFCSLLFYSRHCVPTRQEEQHCRCT